MSLKWKSSCRRTRAFTVHLQEAHSRMIDGGHFYQASQTDGLHGFAVLGVLVLGDARTVDYCVVYARRSGELHLTSVFGEHRALDRNDYTRQAVVLDVPYETPVACRIRLDSVDFGCSLARCIQGEDLKYWLRRPRQYCRVAPCRSPFE